MRKKLGEILLASGVVTQDDIDAALSDQSAGEPSRLGDLLVSLGRLSSEQLAQALADQYGIAYVQLPAIPVAVLAEIPEHFQRQNRVVPFRREGDLLSVAVADPPNAEAIDALRLTPGRRIAVYVAAGDEIDAIHAATTEDLVIPSSPPKSSPPAGRALTADDLFADLSLDSASGLRAAPEHPVRADPPADPPGDTRTLEDELFGPGTGPVHVAARVVTAAEPEAMNESAFRPDRDVSMMTASDVSFDQEPQPSSPSGLRELKIVPVGPDPVQADPGVLSLPDWLRTPIAEAAAGPSVMSAPQGEAWSGALDPVAPSKLVVALVKALLRRGVVTEQDLLDLIHQK